MTKDIFEFELGKIYYVKWLDHWAANHWHDPNLSSPVSAVNCTTVGFCSFSDDEMLHLSATFSEEDPADLIHSQCTATMGILKNCITEAWEIKF